MVAYSFDRATEDWLVREGERTGETVAQVVRRLANAECSLQLRERYAAYRVAEGRVKRSLRVVV